MNLIVGVVFAFVFGCIAVAVCSAVISLAALVSPAIEGFAVLITIIICLAAPLCGFFWGLRALDWS